MKETVKGVAITLAIFSAMGAVGPQTTAEGTAICMGIMACSLLAYKVADKKKYPLKRKKAL